MNQVLIAIDPGQSGGIAIRDWKGNIRLHPMPGAETELHDILEDAILPRVTDGIEIRAAVEKVGGFIKGNPSPGGAMFKFGRGVGFIVGWFVSRKISCIEVRPQQWQQFNGTGLSRAYFNKTAWKRHLVDHARKLHPEVKGITLSTADALLILDWLARGSTQQPALQ